MPGFNPFDVTTKRVLKKLGGDKISSKVILDESLSSEPIDNFGGTFYANENADGTEIEVGKTYIVTTDSGSFTAVCKELADGFLYLGNVKPLGAEDTGESYCCFLMYEDGWAFGASDFNNGTHIKIKTSETIVPIDQKYLPGVKEINLADYGIDIATIVMSGQKISAVSDMGIWAEIDKYKEVVFVATMVETFKITPTVYAFGTDGGAIMVGFTLVAINGSSNFMEVKIVLVKGDSTTNILCVTTTTNLG